MGTVVDWDGAAIEGGNPLEAAIGREVYYLHDRAPMGVVAEVIRNDMAEPLGIVVYDEASKEVQRFRETQVEIRDDGRVLVLPSWFRESRMKVLGRLEEMEAVVPVVRKARARGKALAPEEAASAVARAPYEVQRFVDEAVVLRSELIGKLHDLARRQAESKAELGRIQSPGLFGRGSEEERMASVARLRRSLRLNDLTIFAIKDFLLKMETCALFPTDPRAHAMFKEDELRAAEMAAATAEEPPPAEGEGEEEVAEFEAVPEGAAEDEPFEVLEEAEPVEEFSPVDAGPVEEFVPPHAAPTQPTFEDIEALPDMDDTTVRAPTLEEMAWRPPEPTYYETPPPPPQGYAPYGVPPPPPPPPPPPQPQAVPPPEYEPRPEEVEAEPPAGPRMEVKRKERERKGLMGRFGRGKPKRPAVPAEAPAPVEDFEPVAEEVAEFEPAPEAPAAGPQWGEPMPMEGFRSGRGQPVYGEPMPPPTAPSMPPPPTLPPPPQAPPVRPYAPARRPEDLDTEDEVRAAFGYQAQPPPPPAAEAVEEFSPVEDEVAEFEPEAEPVPMPESREEAPKAEAAAEGAPLHAEKDIDKILAMALGKAPPPKSRPTAKPGVREDLSSPISTLMSKTKYKPK